MAWPQWLMCAEIILRKDGTRWSSGKDLLSHSGMDLEGKRDQNYFGREISSLFFSIEVQVCAGTVTYN